LIYKEGVYPTQGTRPIFTTINQIINSKLATIATTMILHNIESDSVRLGFKDNIMHIDYIYKTKTVFSIKEKLELKLEKLRKSKRDDMQAITAVHESGHAICSVFLMQTVPELIYSKTAETDNCGFVYTKYKWNYISKKEILNRLTVFLGGYVAEKFVFGIENITTGAESDINSATRFISEMLKVCGMGEVPAKYQVEDIMTNMYLHDNDNQINKEIKQWIISAVNLAEKLFKKQETLLLQMANYLSDNRMMPKELLQNYCERYGSDFSSDSIIKNGDLLPI
jgi:ATP-dependent Zn protease